VTVGMAPEFVTPPAGTSERMTVSLVSSGGQIRLRTNGQGFGYILHQSVEGLGVGAVENTMAPLSTGGAVLRHQRLVETDMMLPIIVRSPAGPGIRSMMKDLQDVLMVADGTAQILVYDPYSGEARSRRIAYRDGLATPEWKSPNSVKYGITVDCPDPTWYGPSRQITRSLVLSAKPFLSARSGEVATVSRRNLLPNPSFESGLGQGSMAYGGAGSGATSALSTEWAQTGVQSVRISTANATGNDTAFYPFGYKAEAAAAAAFGMTPGKTFTFAATLHIPATLTGPAGVSPRQIAVHTVDSTGAFAWLHSQSEIAPNAVGTYRLSTTFTVPEGAAGVGVRLFLGHGKSATDAVYWDSMTLEEGTTDGSYFDGDTPSDGVHAYQWTGTQHASPSVQVPAASVRAPFFPVVLASSTVEGAFVLDVQGDAEAWPAWEITGPGEDLLIENVTTGDRIFVSGEFKEKVTIVTRPQEQDITSPGATSGELWDRVSVDSVLFPLPPGESHIKMSLVGASAASKVTVTYREAWKAGY
jgi:hypothetical protein